MEAEFEELFQSLSAFSGKTNSDDFVVTGPMANLRKQWQVCTQSKRGSSVMGRQKSTSRCNMGVRLGEKGVRPKTCGCARPATVGTSESAGIASKVCDLTQATEHILHRDEIGRMKHIDVADL